MTVNFKIRAHSSFSPRDITIPGVDPLLSHLRRLKFLTEDEAVAISQACDVRRIFPGHTDIVAEGEAPRAMHILVDGWACRSKTLHDGRRQFPALFVPGDFCDIDALLMERLTYSVTAISTCTVASLPLQSARALVDQFPAIRDGLLHTTFIENAIATEWAVCLGRRSARERIAHLFCELMMRLDAAGLARDNHYHLPLIQEEIADLLGLTSVHVNRTLQGLRADGIISLREHQLTIHDWDALSEVADFNPGYLQIAEPGTEPKAGAAH